MDEAVSPFVGGEFYYDEHWRAEQATDPSHGALFLNGGKACLMVICDYLRDQGIQQVLLPSYLCPTILDTLESCGFSCGYYPVASDFSIDTRDLEKQLTERQAVYFINYFGFTPNQAVSAYLQDLRKLGRLLIEDNAQAGFAPRSIGDFVFNSMRKLCPHDGGYLKTDLNLQKYLPAYLGRENRRLPLIRQYRAQLRDYLINDQGDADTLEAIYSQAEAYYSSDPVVLGDEGERQQIEQLDWPAIKQVRRQNYECLMQLIAGNRAITPIFPKLQADNMPLGLPVYVQNNLRDQLNDYLGEHGIGLTIHWEDLATDPRLQGYPLAGEMASHILTLTVDQYTSPEQLQYLADTLSAFEQS
ncbi:MAG TPA: hypothetical protein VLR89_01645 [Anaerolineaceae bacterium]|nr:hypothetical protein [Anaerolineaceae bacterium]